MQYIPLQLKCFKNFFRSKLVNEKHYKANIDIKRFRLHKRQKINTKAYKLRQQNLQNR